MPSPIDLSALAGADVFSEQGMAVAALLLFRLSGLIWIAPLFSGQAVPGKVKTAILLVFCVLMWPAAIGSIPAGAAVQVTAGTIVIELCVGLTLGLGAAIFVGAAEAAGDMLAVQMGLSGANVVDPMSATQLPVLGQLLGLFVTALILATGGHLVMLRVLHRSLELLPLGQPVNATAGAMAVVGLGGRLLALGLQFAAPVIGAMVMGNATLGILARTVPQLNVLMVAFPVQIALGLFMIAASLPLMATAFAGWPGHYSDLAGSLLSAFANGGGR
jgi:flagellar biosynthetic protein FliR